MASLLSNLVNNLSEGIHKTNCKHEHDELDMKLVEIDTKITSAKKKKYIYIYIYKNYQKKRLMKT